MSDTYTVLVTARRSEQHLHSLNNTYTEAVRETHFTVAFSENTRHCSSLADTLRWSSPQEAVPETRFTVVAPKTHFSVVPPGTRFTIIAPETNFTVALAKKHVTVAVPDTHFTVTVPETPFTVAAPETL